MTKMPSPAKDASGCSLAMLPELGDVADEEGDGSGTLMSCFKRSARVVRALGLRGAKPVNLFEARRLRGFWPCYNDESGAPVIAVRTRTRTRATRRPYRRHRLRLICAVAL